jgi:hypothetical protein
MPVSRARSLFPSLLAASLAASLVDGLAAQSASVTIQPDADATLYEDLNGNTANGAGPSVFVGVTLTGSRRRALLHFDVASAVPAGARIISVQLQLTVAQTRSSRATAVDVLRVTHPWVEGTAIATGSGGGGGFAQPGDCTWIHWSQPNLWTNPGGDFAATASGRFTLSATGPQVFGPSPGMVADVQSWLEGLVPNAGWMLKTDENVQQSAYRIYSREQFIPSQQPQLTIVYVPAGTTLSVGTGCTGSNALPLLQTLAGAPLQGGQVTLGITQGLPGAIAATFLSYGVRLTPITVDTGCLLYLEVLPWPSLGVRVLDTAGSVADTYQIPVASGLFGAPIALQSFALDPGVPRGFVLSNAHLIVFH